MNRLFSVTLLLFCSVVLQGQATMNIYQTNGSILQLDLVTIDSVTYLVDPPPPIMRIHQAGGSVLTLLVNSIDSITYSSGGSMGTPLLATLAPVNITAASVQCGGYISSEGGSAVFARGVCWGLSPFPTTSDNTTVDGNGTGTYISTINGLSAGTIYYMRAYALNSQGVAYGNLVAFSTQSGGGAPTLSTTPLSNIQATTAASGGIILTDGGETILSRGVCWNTVGNPTTANSITTNGAGVGGFSSTLTGLAPSTTYYVRAWATSIFGTGYGNQLSFTTTTGLPTVTTAAVSDVQATTVAAGGDVTGDGGFVVTVRGVCWNTVPGPTTANSTTLNGSGVGPYTSALAGLAPGVTYYMRAYATNTWGTVYGNEVVFSTAGGAPAVITEPISELNSVSVLVGVTVNSDGGSPLTAVGVCWGLTPSPTTSNSTSMLGSDLGTFSDRLVELTSSTTYYLRGYATNGIGTTYGNQISFVTAPAIYTMGAGGVDNDGTPFTSVVYGGEWMSENLRNVTYANGDPIQDLNGGLWAGITEGVWSYRDYSPAGVEILGLVYNRYAAIDPRNVCPMGWHVPDQWEVELLLSLASMSTARCTGSPPCSTGEWIEYDCPFGEQQGTNETGLNVFATGYRFIDGNDFADFTQRNTASAFWDAAGNPRAYDNCVPFLDLTSAAGEGVLGGSIRCKKD